MPAFRSQTKQRLIIIRDCSVSSSRQDQVLSSENLRPLISKCNSVDSSLPGSVTLSTAWVDERQKESLIQGQIVRKSSLSEDFWSSSACEMDHIVPQSLGSISSISASNLPFDACSHAGSTSNPSEFVNHGLLLWNQTRQQWLGTKKSQGKAQLREPSISWTSTYESLLGTSKPFRQRVPLAEMVDFLVDVWEQEGLYDY